MEYINRLENYDAPDVANIAVGVGLYDVNCLIFFVLIL